MSSFYSEVYEAVKRIPEGKVTNYGTIAAIAGRPRSSRLVGWALHVNPDPANIPCHRVVMKDGSLAPAFAFGGPEIQRMLLEKEGVGFTEDGRVNMALYAADIKSI